jgi:hypothetical protein
MMKFAKTTLAAMRLRAASSGSRFILIAAIREDLGGPVDFEEVLEDLHSRGLITLHLDSRAVTLTQRGVLH